METVSSFIDKIGFYRIERFNHHLSLFNRLGLTNDRVFQYYHDAEIQNEDAVTLGWSSKWSNLLNKDVPHLMFENGPIEGTVYCFWNLFGPKWSSLNSCKISYVTRSKEFLIFNNKVRKLNNLKSAYIGQVSSDETVKGVDLVECEYRAKLISKLLGFDYLGVRPHPLEVKQKTSSGGLCENQSSIEEFLEDVDCIISHSSSCLVKAVREGVPYVVELGPYGFINNPDQKSVTVNSESVRLQVLSRLNNNYVWPIREIGSKLWWHWVQSIYLELTQEQPSDL